MTKYKLHLLQRNGVVVAVAVLCTILWGSAFPFVKIGYEWFGIGAGDDWSKLLFAGWRFMLAGLLTIVFLAMANKKIIVPMKKQWPAVLLVSVFQTLLQYLFFYLGMGATSGITGAIVSGTSTFMVVLMAYFALREVLSKEKLLGCLVGFMGIVLISSKGGTLGSGFTFTGEGFVLIAAFSSAIGTIVSKKVAHTGDIMMITGYQLFVGGLALTMIGQMGGGQFVVTPRCWMLLFYLAMISAVAFTLWTMLLKYNPAGKIAVYGMLIPIFGSALAGIFLHEQVFTVMNMSALALVCFGIYVVNLPKEKIAPPIS